MEIFVNGRFKAHKVTGVQRYAHEVLSRLDTRVHVCQPQTKLRGWRGHLWEQAVLPRACRSGLLWSPCASGPLAVRNQVVTFHDLFPLDSPEWYRPAYVAWYRLMMSRLATSSRHLIAVSQYTKQRLCDQFNVSPSKITVIYSGIAEAFFECTAAQAAAAHSALRLPSFTYLLAVGSLEPRKNMKGLLAAWAQVVGEVPNNVWLVVAGSNEPGVYSDSHLNDVPARVCFTGYVPDCHLAGLYRSSLALLYPSLGEGFGFPPLEAMACGTPVLTSNLTALPEVCSSSALLVNPRDTAEIAHAILRLVNDPILRCRLSESGRLRARAFSWSKTARETLQVLTDLLSSSPLETFQYERTTASH